MKKKRTCVFIMAGGVGSRFWPKSRNNFPKQFIDILGTGKSLLQLTYERFARLEAAENIYVVTNNQYRALVQQQLPAVPVENILCEPSRNNTGPCVAYAVFKLAAKDPEANMVVAPSDHFIVREDIFIEKIRQAVDIAAEHPALLTLGITPTRPDTGYGYINFGEEVGKGVYLVNRFIEKPPLEKAREFVANGSYVWNGGIFIWNVKTALAAFQQYAPEIHDLFAKGAGKYNTGEEQPFIDQHYPLAPNISIDYAVMEKADNVYTIPADFGWSDLGTWGALYEVAEKQDGQNVVSGNLLLEDTENSIIHLPSGKVAVIRGLKDYIVVDDENVLLIYPKGEEQEIKKVTEKLKSENQAHYL